MSKGVGEMVRSRSVQVKASAGRREPGGRPECPPTARQVRRGPWRRGSAGAWAGSGTWCCGCCEANRWRRCRGKWASRIYRLEDWRDRAVAGLERGLQARQGDPVAEAFDAAKRHIGELSMENELLRERARAAEQHRPLAMRRSRR